MSRDRYKLPDHHKDLKEHFPDGFGPRLLGAQICRFDAHFSSGSVRRMVRNSQYWYEKLQSSLLLLNNVLPLSMKCLAMKQTNAVHDYVMDKSPAIQDRTREWHTQHGLSLGEVEHHNQLGAISQRESLPVHKLKKVHLKVPANDEPNAPLVVPSGVDAMMVAIARHRVDYERYTERMKNLMWYCEHKGPTPTRS